MSKPNSSLFHGTKGTKTITASGIIDSPETIIAERTKDLDLTPHPRKSKAMNSRQIHSIRNKIQDRTATKEEYKALKSEQRFRKRRAKAVHDFWKEETKRLLTKSRPTRQWTPEQIKDIINGKRPKYKGKTIQGHHSYSAQQYPHLANNPNVIFPATYMEHLHGWHGNNYNTSHPGKRIIKLSEF